MAQLKKQYMESGVSVIASFNIYAEYLRQKGQFIFSDYLTGFENENDLDVIVHTTVDMEELDGMRGRVLMEINPIDSLQHVQVKGQTLSSLVNIVDHALQNPGTVTRISQTKLERFISASGTSSSLSEANLGLKIRNLSSRSGKQVKSTSEKSSSSSQKKKKDKSSSSKKTKKQSKGNGNSVTGPTSYITTNPSGLPSNQQTVPPTALPTDNPTQQSDTDTPSITITPTTYPKVIPSNAPSFYPIKGPSSTPSMLPSLTPTNAPSGVPSKPPTEVPSHLPSHKPTVSPSAIPTTTASLNPTNTPSDAPSKLPTDLPSMMPSHKPTVSPSVIPTTSPSETPSIRPTAIPSALPNPSPSAQPTRTPLFIPEIPLYDTGSVIAEARYSHKLNEVFETYGIIGQGIRVGVVSYSVDFLEELVGSGELPNDVTVEGNVSDGSSLGTAILEVVYDLCPGCKLYFASGLGGKESFAASINLLYEKHHCDVIVSDIKYANESYFQDDIVAQAIDYVSSNGVFFYSTAGNFGNSPSGVKNAYYGEYDPSQVGLNSLEYSDAHKFSDEYEYLNPINTPDLDHKSDEVLYVLHYSEPLGNVRIDLDFFVLDKYQSVVTSSTTDNIITGNPSENLFVSGHCEACNLVIARYIYSNEGNYNNFSTTCQKIHIEAWSPYVEFTTYSSPLRNIYGSAVANSAFSVAAIATFEDNTFDQSSVVEFYSSEGPHEICFNQDGSRTVADGTSGCVERGAPIISAGTVVSVTTPGIQPYFIGTAASMAVAGAITAVLLEAFPDLDRNVLLDAYNATSIDIMSQGFDSVSGFGIIDGLALFDFILSKQSACVSLSECPDGSTCTCLSNASCYCKRASLNNL
jgi:hypothetical protein